MNTMRTSIDKGRAISARPLSRLLPALLLVALLVTPATIVSAAPRAPKLTNTMPSSSGVTPASSTEPLVVGEAEPETEVITQGTRSLFSSRGPITSAVTQHPEYEIVIFATSNCQGAPLETGLAGTLEDPGIRIVVAENSMTSVSAWQVDPADPADRSACSNSLTYWEGIPPVGGGGSGGGGAGGGQGDDPVGSLGSGSAADGSRPGSPRLRIVPSHRANDNSPSLTGSAPAATSVKIFIGADCDGAPVARLSADQLADGVEMEVADDTTTAFSAVAVAGAESACSAPITYVEDSTPPRTRITMAPGAKTRKHKAVFRFTNIGDDPPGTSFLCKVDRAKWKPCSSPLRLRRLRFSRYVVRVRALDVAGNAETRGVKRSFKVVRPL